MTDLNSLTHEQLEEACGCMESALVRAILRLREEGHKELAAELHEDLKLAQAGIDWLGDH